jgi:di/tricarboxylate transporter
VRLVYKVLLYNLAVLVGCILAMLLVPDNTPYLLFFGICALVFVGVNVALFIVPRYRPMDQRKVSKNRSSSPIVWWVIGAVLLANFLLKYGHRLFSSK